MKYRRMSATGLTVSRLCLGTMIFGGQVSREDSIEMIHAALDMGINFIDTADVYVDGESESILGEALSGRRDDVILATKVRLTRHEDVLNSGGLTRRHIMKQIDCSLKRLQTDYIDIYYMHTPDPETPIEETLDAMNDLVRAGKIRYLGVSNFSSWQLSDMLWSAKLNRTAAPIITENVYNLLCRSVEPELVPCIREHKVGMTVFNPLAGGLLTGKHHFDGALKGSRFDNNKMYNDRYWNEDSFKGVELLREVARQYGLSLPELSIKWCAQHDFVDSVIVGSSKMEHLVQNLGALEGEELPEEALKQCDEVWTAIAGTRYQYNR